MTKEKPKLDAVATKIIDLYYAYYNYNYTEVSKEVVKEMLKDPDIYSAWVSRKNCIQAREWKIRSVNGNEKLEKEIELRFAGLNLSKVIGEILDSKIYGRSFHELIWKDENPFQWKYKELLKEPIEAFRLTKERKWVLSSDKALPENKFVISVNEGDFETPYGKSLFEPLLKTFERKTLSYNSINNFITRFYDIIMWYVYDSSQEDDEIKAQAEAIRKIKSQDLIALPSSNSSDSRGLNKDFGFMTLDNFTTETQQTILRLSVQEIEMVIKGASFAKAGDTAGSYSKDSVSNEVRNDIIESDVKYLRDCLQQLIEIDAHYFGYDSNEVYFTFIKGEDKLKQAEILQSEENAKKTEAEKLQVIKELGFDIDVNYISERFGIPINVLTKRPEELLNFEEINDYLLKKKEVSQKLTDKFYNQIEAEKEGFVSEVLKQIEKLKFSTENIEIDLKFPERFSEILLIANLYGMLNVQETNNTELEFAKEENPFKMKFQEAIKYFLGKMPRLYEEIDEINAKWIKNSFWIKKITDIELVKKIKKSLDTTLKVGKTFEQWKKGLDLKGLSEWYVENVFRTNMASAYSAGRFEQQQAVTGTFNYWLYDAVMDNRTSEICSELDGKIYRSDNPIWETIYPPNHYGGCRSDVIALSDYDIRVMGIKSKDIDTYDIQNSETYKKFLEKSDFANNPFKTDYETMYNQKRLL